MRRGRLGGTDIVRRGLLLILSSPSGAGKSTLTQRLMAWDPAIRFSVSATTRAPRPGEVEGQDYYFCSRDEFRQMIDTRQMLEHAEVFGNLYGSPRAPVEQALREGRDTVFDIDWQGGQQIKQAMRDDVVSIFILPPSIAELERRLRARGQDSETVMATRMDKSRDEISHWAEYDYVLVNHDLDTSEAQLRAIVGAERLRRERQPGLSDFVRALNAEFDAR
jgi:guanylate kinase